MRTYKKLKTSEFVYSEVITNAEGLIHHHPVFKFLSTEHKDALTKEGKVRLSTLYEFRDTEKHIGKIGDKNEGLVKFRIPSGVYELKDSKISIKENCYKEIKSPDCNIYCTSGTFSLELLKQAAIDKNESCVMITNPKLFLKTIENKTRDLFKLQYHFFSLCAYCKFSKENVVEPSFDQYQAWVSETNNMNLFFLTPPFLIKEKKYFLYDEVRAIFSPQNLQDTITPKIFSAKELIDFVIPIDFSNLKLKHFQGNSNVKIKIEIIDKKKEINAFFTCLIEKNSMDFLSPFVLEKKGEKFLAFEPVKDKRGIKQPCIGNNCVLLLGGFIQAMQIITKLEDISEIKYSSDLI